MSDMLLDEMNIFALADDPVVAAQFCCDAHVVKMPTEAAQMLSSIWRIRSKAPPELAYQISHEKHPCTLWAMSSTGNYRWLVKHAFALIAEHQYRYPDSPVHASIAVIRALESPPVEIEIGGLTPFVQCMPIEYKRKDPIIAYRLFYMGEKTGFAKWTKRPEPYWLHFAD